MLLAFVVGLLLLGMFLFELENIFGHERLIVIGFVFFKEFARVHVEDLLRSGLQ